VAASWSLHALLADYYAGNPDGVINGRWADTHWDFRSSEYEAMSENGTELGW
jgi:alpha-L-fucosidase